VTEIDPKLSRIYHEAASEVPPAALDALILAAARQQVAKPRRGERSQRDVRSFWSRWMAPAGAIATLVLGVSLALLIEREQPESTGSTVIRETSPRPQSAPSARATEATPPQPADHAAPAGVAQAPAAAERAASAAVTKQEAPVVSAPAQAPAPRPAEMAPPAAPAFPAEESRAKAAAPRMAAPSAAAESNAAGASALGGAGTAAPSAPAAGAERAPLRPMKRSPEAWIDEISRLKGEGREKEAAEQLALFRKAYPEYTLPQRLRDLQQ